MSTFKERLAEIYASLNDSTVLFVEGKAKEGKDGQRRRVHFYRRGGVFEPPNRAGNWAQGTVANESRFTRVEEIEAVIVAEDNENASILLDNLAHAIEKTYPGDASRLKVGSYEWQENEIAQRGSLIRWRFALAFPANPEQTSLRTVLTVNNVSEFE